jgi:hypothetical protein
MNEDVASACVNFVTKNFTCHLCKYLDENCSTESQLAKSGA